jgi:hypothetical protein
MVFCGFERAFADAGDSDAVRNVLMRRGLPDRAGRQTVRTVPEQVCSLSDCSAQPRAILNTAAEIGHEHAVAANDKANIRNGVRVRLARVFVGTTPAKNAISRLFRTERNRRGGFCRAWPATETPKSAARWVFVRLCRPGKWRGLLVPPRATPSVAMVPVPAGPGTLCLFASRRPATHSGAIRA